MSETERYRVNEIFASVQGEGYWTGTAAVFVRFAMCNLRCPFCDTDFDAYTEMTVDEILAEVNRYAPHTIILTGGEPALQVDERLIDALHAAGKRIHIETNGTRPLPSGIDWVTLSPKAAPTVLERIDELKVVYEGQDLTQYDCYICPNRFLQPCSNQNIQETFEAVLTNPQWRLSLQTHKLIGVR
ncbi:MAG: radical SAM protein [Bacteroidaceae bacterium]|nr:radical SAM protein [Bacteroidaceae bacterium]